jgi:MFS family permease
MARRVVTTRKAKAMTLGSSCGIAGRRELPMMAAMSPKTRIGSVDFEDARTRQALVAAAWDGVFATLMLGIVETFGVAGAVTLGVPSAPIALLGPLPTFIGALAQLGLGRRVAGRGRKPLVVTAVRTQATMLLVLALTGWAPARWAAPLYVITFLLYGASNAAVGHLWMSWIADLCPERVIGRHMAWRSTIFACVQLATTALAGWLARGFTSATANWTLYAIAFAVAAAARYVSAWFLSIQYEPACTAAKPVAEAFQPPVALARFAKAIALLQGSALLAGPFFAVWFLRDLRFSYLEFALAGACSLLGQLLANRWVGRLADELGAARVLKVGAVFAALVPVPYLFIESAWAVWLSNFGSGMAWAAVNLAAFKYLVQASRGGPDRSGFVYANLWLTSTTLVMGLVGGLLAPHLPVVFVWPLQTLFLVSAVARIAVVLGLFPRIIHLEPTEPARRWGPGRFFQIFRWNGPGTSQV